MRRFLTNMVYSLGGASLLRRSKVDTVTVLCLHRISNEYDFFFNPITPEQFENLVIYCKKYYSIITFRELEKPTEKPKLIFSFDDGYYDFIEHAIPVLKKHQVSCNHNFVNTCLNDNEVIWTQKVNDTFNYLRKESITNDVLIKEIGDIFHGNWMTYYLNFFNQLLKLGTRERRDIVGQLVNKYEIVSKYRMMTWEDLKRCQLNHRIEIGSHTYSHESLSNVDDPYVLDIEIGDSILEFEKILNEKIDIISLPNGQFNNTVLEYIEKKGIKHILLIEDDLNPIHNNQLHSRLVKRIYLMNEPFSEMVLRTELFHAKLRRKYGQLFHKATS